MRRLRACWIGTLAHVGGMTMKIAIAAVALALSLIAATVFVPSDAAAGCKFVKQQWKCQ